MSTDSSPLTSACLNSFRTLGQEISRYSSSNARDQATTSLEKSRLWVEKATAKLMVPVIDPGKAFPHGQPDGAFRVLFESIWTELEGGYESSKAKAEAKTALTECYLWISAADAANHMTGDVVTVTAGGATEVTLGNRPIVFSFEQDELAELSDRRLSDVIATGGDPRRATALVVAMQFHATAD
jgi:hypothetical protein